MDPSAYGRHFGIAPPTGEGARLAALIVSVRDMAAAAAALAKADVPAAKVMGRLVVGPQAAMGATIVFEAA
jgi:hypothetical protein